MSAPGASQGGSHWGAIIGITLIVLLLAAGGGYFFYTQYMQAPAAPVEETAQVPAPSPEDTIEADLNAAAEGDSTADLDSLQQSL